MLTGTGSARHGRSRPVGEEVEDRECTGEDRAREAECGDLRPAEMPDDRRVDEDVERLRGQRSERRQCEPQDLAIVRGAKSHRARTIMGAVKVGIVVPYSWSFWGGVVEHAELQAEA